MYKKMCSTVLVLSLLPVFFGCQTSYTDNGFQNIPDQEAFLLITRLTVDLIQLRLEYAEARRTNDYKRQLDLILLIANKAEELLWLTRPVIESLADPSDDST